MPPDPYQNDRKTPVEEESIVLHDHLGAHASSSEEETDVSVNEDYMLLPQGPENEVDCESINYNSLSGIMYALSTNGPTEIIETNSSSSKKDSELLTNASSSKSADISSGSKTGAVICPSPEQASLWNAPTSNHISLDKSKEDKIKFAMARFTLPPSSIPSWAKDVSDEELQLHLKSRLNKEL